jgi:hypothetical protein
MTVSSPGAFRSALGLLGLILVLILVLLVLILLAVFLLVTFTVLLHETHLLSRLVQSIV